MKVWSKICIKYWKVLLSVLNTCVSISANGEVTGVIRHNISIKNIVAMAADTIRYSLIFKLYHIDGTLTFEEFSDLVQRQDNYKRVVEDFLEFVKTISFKN